MDSLHTERPSFSREWVKTLSSWRLVQAKRSGLSTRRSNLKGSTLYDVINARSMPFFFRRRLVFSALFSYPQCNLVILYGLQPTILIQKFQLVVLKIHEQTFVVLFFVVPLRIEPLLVGYRICVEPFLVSPFFFSDL